MAPSRKHGGHRYTLSVPPFAAGSGSDGSDMLIFDSYALAGTATVPNWPYDITSYVLSEAAYTVDATFTGQATNFASICLQHIRAAAVVNEIRVVYSATGVTTAKWTAANMAVASGVTVPNAGTGTLLVQTGAALPWTIQPGDIIALQRLSNNATGLASPAISMTIVTGESGT